MMYLFEGIRRRAKLSLIHSKPCSFRSQNTMFYSCIRPELVGKKVECEEYSSIVLTELPNPILYADRTYV